MSNHAHDDMDETAEFGNRYRGCYGDCDQGRKACECEQSNSADGEVLELLLRVFLYVLLIGLCGHIAYVSWTEIFG